MQECRHVDLVTIIPKGWGETSGDRTAIMYGNHAAAVRPTHPSATPGMPVELNYPTRATRTVEPKSPAQARATADTLIVLQPEHTQEKRECRVKPNYEIGGPM